MKRTRPFALALAALAALACAAVARQGPSQYPKATPFTDEDLKAGKLSGPGAVGPGFDNSQLNDPSVPVVVKGINMISGDPTTKFIGLVKLQGADLENRGAKATSRVQLRWALVNRDEPEKVLLEGVTPYFDARVGAGESLKTDTPPIFFNRIVQPLLVEGRLEGRFDLRVGVGEVAFEDGTVWRR
jgi:hypothetical protein